MNDNELEIRNGNLKRIRETHNRKTKQKTRIENYCCSCFEIENKMWIEAAFEIILSIQALKNLKER